MCVTPTGGINDTKRGCSRMQGAVGLVWTVQELCCSPSANKHNVEPAARGRGGNGFVPSIYCTRLAGGWATKTEEVVSTARQSTRISNVLEAHPTSTVLRTASTTKYPVSKPGITRLVYTVTLQRNHKRLSWTLICPGSLVTTRTARERTAPMVAVWAIGSAERRQRK